MDFSQFSDRELYKKCCEIGLMVLKYRNQFLGMLPEVERRKLYRKYGMHSVYEFASRLAGVSHDSVTEVLRVHQLFQDKPLLQDALVSGNVPYTKLRAIATIATGENQEQCLEKVKTMSAHTLETYVHDIKQKFLHVKEFEAENQNLFGADFSDPSSRPSSPAFETFSVQLRPETVGHLRVLKQRFEKEKKEVLTWQQVMEEVLKMMHGQQKINQLQKQEKIVKPPKMPFSEDDQTSKAAPVKEQQQKPKVQENSEVQCVTRHIPNAIQRQIRERSHGLCEFPHCMKPFDILHHTERFSLKREHRADTIIALCIAHERIAHHGLIGHEEQKPENWTLLTAPDITHPKYQIDQMVQKYRAVKKGTR